METLRRIREQFADYWRGLGLARRVMLVALTAGILLAISATTYFSSGETYRVLYSDLAPEETGAMRTKLTAAAIESRIEAGGTTLLVPEKKLAEAKVALAADGLPSRGGKGYELFDESSLTATPFTQGVNYQRALQAELARSIMQIEPVQNARVLVARSEPTPFIRDQKQPTASVVLKLKPGGTMTRTTAAAIVSLVARSVQDLKPEHVTIVDSTGRLLSDPRTGEQDNLPTPQLEYRRELENYLSTKAEDVLARQLGAGRAVVRVSADINFQKLKERREIFSSEGRVAVAERIRNSKTASPAPAGGVAGAASNVARAGGPSTSTSSSGGGSDETSEFDYLVPRTVRDTEEAMGAVTRLTIAAVADLSDAEGAPAAMSLLDAQEIIKQAVGFKAERDEIKVTNAKLVMPATPAEPDEDLAKIQRMTAYVGLARTISLALAIVFALAVVPLLLLRRRKKPDAAAPPVQVVETKAKLDELALLARSDPARVAEVINLLLGAPR